VGTAIAKSAERPAIVHQCQSLERIQGQRLLDARKVKTMNAQDFEIVQLVAHAQFVVGLELVTVTSPADAFQVLSAVRIPGL